MMQAVMIAIGVVVVAITVVAIWALAVALLDERSRNKSLGRSLGIFWNTIQAKDKQIAEMKGMTDQAVYRAETAEKDLELSHEIYGYMSESNEALEKLVELKDQEINEIERRCYDLKAERQAERQDVAPTELMPRTHRELLEMECRDHRNTKMLLDLAEKANLQYADQVELLKRENQRLMALTGESEELLDNEAQALEELRLVEV